MNGEANTGKALKACFPLVRQFGSRIIINRFIEVHARTRK